MQRRKGNVREVGRKIDFLGYQFDNDKTLLRKSTKKNFARKIKTKSKRRRNEVMGSYWGQCKHGDCRNLWNKLTNNYMGFLQKGIKPSNKTRDGKKFFNVGSTRIMDILNTPITILDFEANVETAKSKDAYIVLFSHDGVESKFITTSYNIKDILDQAREAENNDNKIFPVENVVIKRRSIGENKSAYYFE